MQPQTNTPALTADPHAPAAAEAPQQQVRQLSAAIAERVGQQRYDVWFRNSTRIDLRHDTLEISVPDDFISDWIGKHFATFIREATHEVLGCTLPVRFHVQPQLFGGKASPHAPTLELPAEPQRDVEIAPRALNGQRLPRGGDAKLEHRASAPAPRPTPTAAPASASPTPAVSEAGADHAAPFGGAGAARLRHVLDDFVVGANSQVAFNSVGYVAEFPGGQYNPLFVHGSCGMGKTHLLQGLCRRFARLHPGKRWAYLTGEDFTNEFIGAVRNNRLDGFRRKMRELDLLVIDDVHFLSGKKSTQEEFLHTFNAIEATGRQVVMSSDAHPRTIERFCESLVNRFICGMVVRVDPPNHETRRAILKQMAGRRGLLMSDEAVEWVSKRVTQNVRELEGALTRVAAVARLTGDPTRAPALDDVKAALGDLDRQLVAPLKPEAILGSVCEFFGLEHKELASGRRQRTVSLARSVAMYLIRKNARLSFPEVAGKLGKRNHSTVISACRRVEKSLAKNERLTWEGLGGDRSEDAQELVQRLEEMARARNVEM